jgi:putative ABC transport system permease protein
VAAATLLLIGSGLLVKSLLHLTAAGGGFNVQQVLTAKLQLSHSRYSTDEQALRFYDQLLTQVRNTPSVTSAGLIDFLPFAGLHNNAPFLAAGSHDSDLWKGPLAEYRVVSPEYFRSLEIPLLAGRDFNQEDSENHPKTVIVSRNLAQQMFGGVQQAIGKRLRVTFVPNEWVEVIGVAGDVKHWSVGEEPSRYIYFPILQWEAREFFAVVRASGDLESLVSPLQAELAGIDKEQIMFDVKPMAKRYAESFGPYQMNLLAVGSFAIVTLILAGVGLYGVIAFIVAQRTREIGIRVALGAQSRRVLLLMMRQCWAVTVSGLVLGCLTAVVGSRFLGRFLYKTGKADPTTFLIVAASVLLLATAAGFFASRGAIGIEPAEALRQE